MNNFIKKQPHSLAGDLAISLRQTKQLDEFEKKSTLFFLEKSILFFLDSIPAHLLPRVRAAETSRSDMTQPSVPSLRPRFINSKKLSSTQTEAQLAISRSKSIKSWITETIRQYGVRAVILNFNLFFSVNEKQLINGFLNRFSLHFNDASSAEINQAKASITQELKRYIQQNNNIWRIDINNNEFKQLGKGGNAVVFSAQKVTELAEDPAQTLAVKKLLLKGEPETDNRLQAEARVEFEMLQAISHPAFPKIYALIENQDEDQCYLIMDKIQGRKFKHRDECFLSNLAHLHQTITSILEAIVYLEGLGIFHGDIKPDNIMFTPEINPQTKEVVKGAVTVFDLGSASCEKTFLINALDDMPCSPGFEPPEAVRGRFGVGEKPVEINNQAANMYALGKTINCLLHLVVEPDEINDQSPRQPTPAEKKFISKLLNEKPELRPSCKVALEEWGDVVEITGQVSVVRD